MHNSFIFQQYVCYTTILNMFRAARCTSSGGQIVSPQPLVSSPSVSSRTVCRWRADWKFKKKKWKCEHITRAAFRTLEGARASEGPWSLNFVSVTVNPPQRVYQCSGESQCYVRLGCCSSFWLLSSAWRGICLNQWELGGCWCVIARWRYKCFTGEKARRVFLRSEAHLEIMKHVSPTRSTMFTFAVFQVDGR